MKISKFELAAVKRTASTVKSLRRKADNIKKVIDVNTAVLESYVAQIESWEKPLLDKFGYDSKFILEHYNPETKEFNVPVPQEESSVVEEIPLENADGLLRPTESTSEETSEETFESTPESTYEGTLNGSCNEHLETNVTE